MTQQQGDVHRMDPVEAVATIYQLMPGAAEFQVSLGMGLELAAAFGPYNTFTPQRLRTLIEAIFHTIPDAQLLLGWTAEHAVFVTILSRFNRTVVWKPLLSALGEAQATYELDDLDFRITWPLTGGLEESKG